MSLSTLGHLQVDCSDALVLSHTRRDLVRSGISLTCAEIAAGGQKRNELAKCADHGTLCLQKVPALGYKMVGWRHGNKSVNQKCRKRLKRQKHKLTASRKGDRCETIVYEDVKAIRTLFFFRFSSWLPHIIPPEKKREIHFLQLILHVSTAETKDQVPGSGSLSSVGYQQMSMPYALERSPRARHWEKIGLWEWMSVRKRLGACRVEKEEHRQIRLTTWLSC